MNASRKYEKFLNELSSVKHWKREQTLGSGSFAIITLWINTETNQRIALKQNKIKFNGLRPEQLSYYKERWSQEIKIMKKLECENVVKALELPKEFNELRINPSILAMEYCSGGDLRKILNKSYNCCGLKEKEVRQILKQISWAIIYLHNLKIIHRDLKPENIVLQPDPSGKIFYKLTDLGYAKELIGTTFADSFVGTAEYLAPELFLKVKYSTAVDNWSFGLLAYEIITGQRPFMPNYSIASILPALKNKKSSHICTEFDFSSGDYYFSKEISPMNRISNTLKMDLELWLRIVLEYDPEKRGGKNALEMVNQIMNRHKVQIFSINSYETSSLEIDKETKLNKLKEGIFISSRIKPENQYLIFENGDVPEERIGKQIIETWYTPDSWFERYNPITIFMFDYSKELHYTELYKFLVLPPMVENMLMNTDLTINYEELKYTWRCSVFVAQQTVSLYTLVHETLKSCLLNCMKMYNELQNHNQTLFHSLNELFTSVDLLEKLIKSNYHNFLSDPNETNNIENGHHKTQIDNRYLEIFFKLKTLYIFRNEKLGQHFDNSHQIVPKFDKETFMFEEFLKSPEIDPSLMSKLLEIQNAYDTIRKRKKEEFYKFYSSNIMVKLLCDCFGLVGELIDKKFKVLSILIIFIKSIDKLRKQSQQFQNEINKWKNDYLGELFEKAIKLKNNNSPTESTNLNGISEHHSSVDDIIFQIEKEKLLWKSKHFDFSNLEFHNFLF